MSLSGPSAAGTSSRAEGPTTAKPASKRPALRRGAPGADGRLCPYREHALISRQEHEAWGVLLACRGQLRLAPSGHVDRGRHERSVKIGPPEVTTSPVLSELLAAAEAGLALAADAWNRSIAGLKPHQYLTLPPN